MSEELVVQTLEQKYIEESKLIFKNADSSLIEKIDNVINSVSSQINIVLRMNISPEQKKDTLSDIADYVPSELKNNSLFSNLLDKFISEKINIKITSTKLNTVSLNEDTIDNKIEKILNLSQKLQENIAIINSFKQDIEGMGEVLCPKILNIANKLLDDVVIWLEKNIPEMQLSIKTIKYTLVILEKEKILLSLTQEQENNIYDSEGNYLSSQLINEIESLIHEIKQFISIYEDQIKQVSLLKISIDKEQIDIAEDNSREKIIIQEMLCLFDESYKNRILGNILHIYERVEDVINSDLSHSEKINELKNPFKAFQPAFLDDNMIAIDLLKTLVEIKIERYLISVDKSIYGLRYNIPKKYFISVILLLNKIVKEYLGDDQDNEAKKTIIRKKCDKFIEELDRVIPKLLQENSEKIDFNIFKTQNIKDILRELKIPERFHIDLMKIVDLYYKEKKENYDFEKMEKSKPISELDSAYLNLKEGLKKCTPNMLVLCEKFIIHVQINLPLEVGKIMIDKINEERISYEPEAGTANIIKKMQRNTLGVSLINETPYDKALNESSSKNEIKNELPTIFIGKKIPETIEEKIINYFIDMFPQINNKEIKNILRVFLGTYCKYEIEEAMKRYHIAKKVFSDIKDKTES